MSASIRQTLWSDEFDGAAGAPPDPADRYRASFVDGFTGWQRIELPFTAFQPVGATAGAEAPELDDVWGYGFILPAGDPGSFLIDRLRFLD